MVLVSLNKLESLIWEVYVFNHYAILDISPSKRTIPVDYFLLKPVLIWWISRNACCVAEWNCLKPKWWLGIILCSSMCLSIRFKNIFSNILLILLRREIGLYDIGFVRSSSVFGIKDTNASLQLSGKYERNMQTLKIYVR